MYLCHAVGIFHQFLYLMLACSSRSDLGTIADVARRLSCCTELAVDFNLDARYIDPSDRSLTVYVVAIAGGEGEEEKLSSVGLRAFFASFSWNVD